MERKVLNHSWNQFCSQRWCRSRCGLKKKHLIRWVLGGFTNIAIKQPQCFYCALDLKIEAGLTAGSRRTYGKGLVFVCLCGDEWPVSTRWLVCTIKLSKRKDFSLIVPFREELWNSELFATAMELAGLRRGEGEGQTEFSSPRPVWHSSQRGRGDKCGSISSDAKINLSVVANGYPSGDTAVRQLDSQVGSEQELANCSENAAQKVKTSQSRKISSHERAVLEFIIVFRCELKTFIRS